MSMHKEIKSHEIHQWKEKFQILLDIARKAEENRSKLCSLYVEWCDTTNDTAESILKIREEIMKHNLNSNIASLTGTSTAIVGSVVSIIGVVFAIPSAGLSLSLTAGGATIATLGGAVAAGSVITRNVLSKQQCEEAKRVFSKNVSLTESLEEQREFYFSLVDQFKNEMEKFPDTFSNNFQRLSVFDHFSEVLGTFSKDFNLDEDARNSLPPTSLKMCEIEPKDVEQRDMLKYLSELLELIQKDPLLKKYFLNSELWKIVNKAMKQLVPDVNLSKIFTKGSILHGITEGSFAAGRTIMKSASSLKDSLKGISMTFRIGMGVLNSIFVIWGIVDLVMTSIDVHNGSTSNESEKLLRVAEELKKYREEVIKIMETTFEWYI